MKDERKMKEDRRGAGARKIQVMKKAQEGKLASPSPHVTRTPALTRKLLPQVASLFTSASRSPPEFIINVAVTLSREAPRETDGNTRRTRQSRRRSQVPGDLVLGVGSMMVCCVQLLVCSVSLSLSVSPERPLLLLWNV